MATSTSDAEVGRAAGPLDLHEGIGDPAAPAVPAVAVETRCERWPASFFLRGLGPSGVRFVQGRCGCTNLCSYCQRLYVVETVEMLTLDAAEYAPTIWAVFTAREHLTRAECRDHLRQLRKAAKKQWPAIEWFVQVEFQRRGALHLNLLIKGVPVEEVDELRELLVERWCERVDAEPVAQWCEPIDDGLGVVRYISKMLAHGLKAEQAPPLGWRGHRTSQTRGYLVRPASVMREEARRVQQDRRRLWKAEQQLGDDATAELIELYAALLKADDEVTTWTLVEMRRHNDVLEPLGVIEQRDPFVRLRGGRVVDDETGEIVSEALPPPAHVPMPPRDPAAAALARAEEARGRAVAAAALSGLLARLPRDGSSCRSLLEVGSSGVHAQVGSPTPPASEAAATLPGRPHARPALS